MNEDTEWREPYVWYLTIEGQTFVAVLLLLSAVGMGAIIRTFEFSPRFEFWAGWVITTMLFFGFGAAAASALTTARKITEFGP